MTTTGPNRFGLFLTAEPGARGYSAPDLARGLADIPGLLHTHLYTRHRPPTPTSTTAHRHR